MKYFIRALWLLTSATILVGCVESGYHDRYHRHRYHPRYLSSQVGYQTVNPYEASEYRYRKHRPAYSSSQTSPAGGYRSSGNSGNDQSSGADGGYRSSQVSG